MQYFRIYGKEKTARKFKALDYSRGALVDNLIYATLIKEDELEKARKALKYLNSNNPEFIFELRAV
jgi:hypothetical protein